MGVKDVQGIKKEYYDNLKVPYVLYSFGNNGCFQVEWKQMIGMSILLSKVDRKNSSLPTDYWCGKWWSRDASRKKMFGCS